MFKVYMIISYTCTVHEMITTVKSFNLSSSPIGTIIFQWENLKSPSKFLVFKYSMINYGQHAEH